jgi:hypothetical protein
VIPHHLELRINYGCECRICREEILKYISKNHPHQMEDIIPSSRLQFKSSLAQKATSSATMTMGRKQLPPSDNSKLEEKRERDRRRRAVAKAGGGAAAFSPSVDNNAMNGKILVLRNELATVLNKPVDEIPLIKCKNGLYNPIDALMIISEKDRQNAAHDLRVICDKYNLCKKLTHVAFGGQGNHSNSKGCDLPTLVEIMMLSPSQKGATSILNKEKT